MINTPDIWHTKEKHGGQVLHVIKTRDTATAQAAMAGRELLEALEKMIEWQVSIYDNRAALAKDWVELKRIARNAIAKAKEAL